MTRREKTRLDSKIRRYLAKPGKQVETKHSIPCPNCTHGHVDNAEGQPVPCSSCNCSGTIEQPSTFKPVGRTPPQGYVEGMTGAIEKRGAQAKTGAKR